MTSKLTPTCGVCLCLGGFLLLVGIDLLIDEHTGLIAGLADVRQGFARPELAAVLFVLLAPPIPIEKADRHTVLTDRDSTGQIAILPEDPAGIIGGQRLEFFDGDFGHKRVPPTFPPTKTLALDGRYWTLVEQNTAGAQVNTRLEKSRVKFWKLSRSMKKEMGG